MLRERERKKEKAHLHNDHTYNFSLLTKEKQVKGENMDENVYDDDWDDDDYFEQKKESEWNKPSSLSSREFVCHFYNFFTTIPFFILLFSRELVVWLFFWEK